MQSVGMADNGFINQKTSWLSTRSGVTLFPAYNSPCSYKVSSLTDTARVRARLRAEKNGCPPGTGYIGDGTVFSVPWSPSQVAALPRIKAELI